MRNISSKALGRPSFLFFCLFAAASMIRSITCFVVKIQSKNQVKWTARTRRLPISTNEDETGLPPPWNRPRTIERVASSNKLRYRQHVNPLARQFQRPTVLPDNWPSSDFVDPNMPLHLDIGCGKASFLFEYAKLSSSGDDAITNARSAPRQYRYNHLGLEIRPTVAQLAKSRIGYHEGHVDIIGCNVNVDLDRILTLYPGPLELVSIQFPDPHFKSQHVKRRVVTDELVGCIARHMGADGTVFLQSDVQPVLDAMRERFGARPDCFVDLGPGTYLSQNPLGVPTERESSVLERGLPVYRAWFRRTDDSS